MNKLIHLHSPAYNTTYYITDSITNKSIAKQATTHTKLDYKPPFKSFTLNPFNLSNPKESILESKDYTINLDTLPIITRPRDSYMFNITDTLRVNGFKRASIK